MIKNKLFIYLLILAFGLAVPYLFPAYKLQISILWILIILSLTWDVQGGQMGYNTFGNILFFGLGMYLCSSIQIGLFFPLAEWTASGGEKTFVHTPTQYFQGFFVGLILAGIIPALVAAFIGYGILGLRGHYFAICTLGLGIAAGEIAGGIELIGAGQGMTSPPWPKGIGDTELRSEFFYYICFTLMVCTFLFLRWAYQTRFGLVLNAIRDNEDKAVAPITGPHKVPFPPRIAIITIKTPNVLPAKAVSTGSIYPIILPISPPAIPTKNAETTQPVILYLIV